MRWMPAGGSSTFEYKITTSFCAQARTTSFIIQHITHVYAFAQMDFVVDIQILCGLS